MFKKLFFLMIIIIPTWAYSAIEDPYKDLKFYYGDNHFHSGFSGDNIADTHPLAAFINASHQVMQFGTDAKSGGDPTDELGGYFLFISDHVKFDPVRQDMTDQSYQLMRQEANNSYLELKEVNYTFTVFPGGELTGLSRNIPKALPWDGKFGHLNIFNLQNISGFVTNGFIYLKGTTAMDKLTKENGAIGQFNHPGYNNEPKTGDDHSTLYPYTEARDQVFKFFEISDGRPENWQAGVAQYNLCLQKGYHVSPVIGSDLHDTRYALLFQPLPSYKAARTVIIAPATLKMTHENRRKILLESVRQGLVYATEDPNLHIKMSINGFPFGHQFKIIPDRLDIQIDIEATSGHPLKTIELIQNKKCIVDDDQVNDELQCTKVLRSWSDSTPKSQFHLIDTIETKNLNSLKYIYLKLIETNNDRAMTTPFFFG